MSLTVQQKAEYQAAVTGAAVCLRPGRGWIEVEGKDRAAWLSNLVTNVVKTLKPGEGNYAFAVNLKGRCVFDGNILVDAERLWLDLDARLIPAALKHLDKYIITEDVRLRDRTAECGRAAILGPKAHAVVAALGFGNLVPMGQLQHVTGTIAGAEVRLIRHDFTGLATAEFVVPIGSMDAVVAAIQAAGVGVTWISQPVVDMLRIEAGIPASVEDVDDDVVPPETMQVERGISYHKGCYLGQEVIERMRSHGVLPRRLIGLRLTGDAAPPRGSAIRIGENEVGRVTSAAWSPTLGAMLALGYLKTAYLKPSLAVTVGDGGGGQQGELVDLPVRRSLASS